MAWHVIANLKGVPGTALSLEVLEDILEQLADVEQWRDGLDTDSLIRVTNDGVSRTIGGSDDDFTSVELSLDYRRVGGTAKYVAPDGRPVETVLPYTNGQPVHMGSDFRRYQPGADESGLTPQYVLDEWATRMNVGVGLTQLVGWGDSMTTNYGTPGVTSIGEIAAELGVAGIDQGRSGNTQVEIAWRMGALRWGVTVTGGTIPATGTVACTVSPGPGFRNANTWDGILTDAAGVERRVRLRITAPSQMGGTPTWTVEQLGGTSTITVLPDTRVRWDGAEGLAALPCTIWVGRNDSEMNPGSIDRARASVKAMLSQHRDPLRRRVVLPVWNRETEPSGSAQYDLVMAMNQAMQEEAGDDWYDLRAAIIRDGLGIAGITPTSADSTAIGEDRVPPSLMSDITHPNAAGKAVIGRLVANEIKGRNW